MRVAKSSKNRFALYAIECMILKEYKYCLSLASCPVKKDLSPHASSCFFGASKLTSFMVRSCLYEYKL